MLFVKRKLYFDSNFHEIYSYRSSGWSVIFVNVMCWCQQASSHNRNHWWSLLHNFFGDYYHTRLSMILPQKTWPKWLPFCRQNLQIYFVETFISIYFLLKFPWNLWPNWQQAIIGSGNGLVLNGLHTFSEQLMTQFTEAFVGYQALMC